MSVNQDRYDSMTDEELYKEYSNLEPSTIQQDAYSNMTDEELYKEYKKLPTNKTNKSTKNANKQQQTVESMFRDKGAVSNIFGQTVAAPAQEIYKGVLKGSEDFYETLDFIPALLRKAKLPSTDIFDNAAKNVKLGRDELLETEMNPIAKSVYQIIGEAPEMVAKFALLKKVPGMDKITKFGGESLTDAAAMMVDSAMREFAEDEELMSLARGARSGLETGLEFGIAIPIFASALKLVAKAGKAAGKQYVAMTTGNKKAAEDFIENLDKYNTNIFKKVTKSEDVIKENSAFKVKLTENKMNALDDLRLQQSESKFALSERAKDAKFKMKEAQNNAKSLLNKSGEEGIAKVMKSTDEAVNAGHLELNENITNIFTEVRDKVQVLRKAKGEAVDEAIKGIIAADPLAGVKYSQVADDFLTAVKDSPFKIQKVKSVSGNVAGEMYEAVPKIADVGKENIGTFNSIINDFVSKKKDGTITLEYLQNLKSALHSLSFNVKSSNYKLSKTYSDMARAVNPANLAEKYPQIANKFGKLKIANKEYSDLMPKYQEAVKQFFEEDASGLLQPNIKKIMTAIQKNDVPTLRRMYKGDSLLPREEQIIPKVKEAMVKFDGFNTKQVGIVKALKRKIKNAKADLRLKQSRELNNLVKSSRGKSFEQKQLLKEQFNAKRSTESKRLNDIIKELDDHETFLKNQELLRGAVATGKASALIQRVSGLGVLSGIAFSRPVAGVAVGAAASMSPAVASNITKSGIKTAQKAENLMKLLGTPGGRLAKPVIGRAFNDN